MEKGNYFYEKSNVYHIFDKRDEQDFSLKAVS